MFSNFFSYDIHLSILMLPFIYQCFTNDITFPDSRLNSIQKNFSYQSPPRFVIGKCQNFTK